MGIVEVGKEKGTAYSHQGIPRLWMRMAWLVPAAQGSQYLNLSASAVRTLRYLPAHCTSVPTWYRRCQSVPVGWSQWMTIRGFDAVSWVWWSKDPQCCVARRLVRQGLPDPGSRFARLCGRRKDRREKRLVLSCLLLTMLGASPIDATWSQWADNQTSTQTNCVCTLESVWQRYRKRQ